jgi:hypothetical protein
LVRNSNLYGDGQSTVVRDGRIWRSFLRSVSPYGARLRRHAIVCSAALGTDLLRAASWRWSTEMPLDGIDHTAYSTDLVLRESGEPFLLVLGISDEVLLCGDLSADGWLLRASNEGQNKWSTPEGIAGTGLRHDPKSDRYFAITRSRNQAAESSSSRMCYDALALSASKDCISWSTKSVLLRGRGFESHLFDSADWRIDGDDIVMVVRTSFRNPAAPIGPSAWRSVALFVRVPNFRDRTPDTPALWQAPAPK